MNGESPQKAGGGLAIKDRVGSAVTEQKQYFNKGLTREVANRIEILDRLRAMVQRYQDEILVAVAADLGKPALEAYTTEIGIIYQEIDLMRSRSGDARRWRLPFRRAISFRSLTVSALLLPHGTIRSNSPLPRLSAHSRPGIPLFSSRRRYRKTHPP